MPRNTWGDLAQGLLHLPRYFVQVRPDDLVRDATDRSSRSHLSLRGLHRLVDERPHSLDEVIGSENGVPARIVGARVEG